MLQNRIYGERFGFELRSLYFGSGEVLIILRAEINIFVELFIFLAQSFFYEMISEERVDYLFVVGHL